MIAKLKKELNAWLDANNQLLRGEARLVNKTEWHDERVGKGSALTLIIEGSPLYGALNYGEPSWKCESELREIAKRNGYYYEMGYSWSVHFYPA